jgi:hypothetical protein
LAELYDYAALTTASDKSEPAKVTVYQSRKLPQSIVSRRLSGKLTFVIVLGASGKVRGVFPFGFVPRDLKDFYNREIQLMEFKPGAKDGRPVSQFTSVSHELKQFSGR